MAASNRCPGNRRSNTNALPSASGSWSGGVLPNASPFRSHFQIAWSPTGSITTRGLTSLRNPAHCVAPVLGHAVVRIDGLGGIPRLGVGLAQGQGLAFGRLHLAHQIAEAVVAILRGAVGMCWKLHFDSCFRKLLAEADYIFHAAIGFFSGIITHFTYQFNPCAPKICQSMRLAQLKYI